MSRSGHISESDIAISLIKSVKGETMITNKKSYILRGLAMIIVVASHYTEWWPYTGGTMTPLMERISAWGPLGVDIFFLMSGYGLVKSAYKGAGKSYGVAPSENGYKVRAGISGDFVLKRLMGSYIPYLIIIGIINTLGASWAEADAGFIREFLTGYSYWFMNVIFIIYILFILIYKLDFFRIPLITAGIIGMTVVFFKFGRNDFWMLSNLAFLFGIYAAELEERLGKDKLNAIKLPIILLIIGVIGTAVCSMNLVRFSLMFENGKFVCELILNIFFTLVVYGVAVLLPDVKLFGLHGIGKNSLFIYLIHTFVYWKFAWKLAEKPFVLAAVVQFVIVAIISYIIGEAYNTLSGVIIKKITGKK